MKRLFFIRPSPTKST